MNAAIGVLVNDRPVFLSNFQDKSIGLRVFYKEGATSAASGLNELLDSFEKQGFSIAVFLHQDVIVPENWDKFLEQRLAELPGNWLVAGAWGPGVGGNGKLDFFGSVVDTRMTNSGKLLELHSRELPHEVQALDELCLIIKLNRGFRFEEQLSGFDLYGSYVCLWAHEHGFSSWAIKLPIIHDCKRPFDWVPDCEFFKNLEWLEFRFSGRWVTSTVYLNVKGEGNDFRVGI